MQTRSLASPRAPLAALASPSAVKDSVDIDLKPNIIHGTATLTNTNPEILALLDKDPWHTTGHADVYSTNPSGYSATTNNLTYLSPTQFTFDMFVEAAAGGDAGRL